MSNLNFDSILTAINILLDKKLESFPYSLQTTGTIVEKLGSNKYRVQYEGGVIEAIDLNANSEHLKDETVYLLIANSGGTSYILSTEGAGTEEDLSYIFKNFSFEFLTENLLEKEETAFLDLNEKDEQNKFKKDIFSNEDGLNSAGNIFNTTKSFILYTKIQTIIEDPTNGKYFFKIVYDNNDKLCTILDSSMMVGNPYKFYSSTAQTLYFNPPAEAKTITSITFEAESDFIATGNSVKAIDISLFGAPDKSNFIDSKVTVSFKNVSQSAFTSECAQVTLQAELEYNGKRFLPLGMEFFWERLDSPTLQGQIWASLNQSVEKKLGDNTYTELIGRVSNEIVMEKTSANYFENYYRCKVKYLGNTKVSEPFKIINYEKPDFSVSHSFTNKKDTLFASSDSIIVNIAANFLKNSTGYSFQYSWYKKDGESYTVLSGETNSSLTIGYKSEMPIGENIYKCVVQTFYDEAIVGEKEVEIKFYNYVLGEDEKDLVTEITETIYYNSETTTAPSKPTFKDYDIPDGWSFDKPDILKIKFLFASTRRVLATPKSGKGYTWAGYYPANSSITEQKYSQNTFPDPNTNTDINTDINITYFKQDNTGEYIKNPNLTNIPTEWSKPSCIEVGGGETTAALAEQINTFNQLTQNGEQDGFFFNESGEVYVLSKDTSEFKENTYYSYKYEDGKEKYELIKTEETFVSGNPYYEISKEGKSSLYINSTYIRTKTLDVPGKLFASVERNQVTIGGFEVSDNGISCFFEDENSNPQTLIFSSHGIDINNVPVFFKINNLLEINKSELKISTPNFILDNNGCSVIIKDNIDAGFMVKANVYDKDGKVVAEQKPLIYVTARGQVFCEKLGVSSLFFKDFPAAELVFENVLKETLTIEDKTYRYVLQLISDGNAYKIGLFLTRGIPESSSSGASEKLPLTESIQFKFTFLYKYSDIISYESTSNFTGYIPKGTILDNFSWSTASGDKKYLFLTDENGAPLRVGTTKNTWAALIKRDYKLTEMSELTINERAVSISKGDQAPTLPNDAPKAYSTGIVSISISNLTNATYTAGDNIYIKTYQYAIEKDTRIDCLFSQINCVFASTKAKHGLAYYKGATKAGNDLKLQTVTVGGNDYYLINGLLCEIPVSQ